MNDWARQKFPAQPDPASTETSERVFPDVQQLPLALNRAEVTPGSYSDEYMIRRVISDSMKRCGKSRAQIADEISFLVGTEVTERRLNNFSADSREDYLWPASLDRAFALVTGDDRILKCRIEAAGYKVISGAELHLLELGRQYLQRKRSEAEMVEIERRLKESGL